MHEFAATLVAGDRGGVRSAWGVQEQAAGARRFVRTNAEHTGADSSGVGQATRDADGADAAGPAGGMLQSPSSTSTSTAATSAPNSRDIVAAHGKYLASNPQRRCGSKATPTSAAAASTTSASASAARRPCAAC